MKGESWAEKALLIKKFMNFSRNTGQCQQIFHYKERYSSIYCLFYWNNSAYTKNKILLGHTTTILLNA